MLPANGEYNPRHRHPCNLPYPFTTERLVCLPPRHPHFLRGPPLFLEDPWQPTISPLEHRPRNHNTSKGTGNATSRGTPGTRKSTSRRIRIFVTPPISPQHTRKPPRYAEPTGSHSRIRRLLDPRFESIRNRNKARFPDVAWRRLHPRGSTTTGEPITFHSLFAMLTNNFGPPVLLNSSSPTTRSSSPIVEGALSSMGSPFTPLPSAYQTRQCTPTTT